jgi:natural product precursor
MKTIKKLKLDNLSKDELKNRELNLIKGGIPRPKCPCTCPCIGTEAGTFGSVSGESAVYVTIYG